ncbi:MAG: ATP-binding protein [Pseudomonadota bacterium]
MSISVIPPSAPSFFILTGPPGSGKTSLLQAVASDVNTVPEAARRVLAHQRASGGTATGEQDPAAFIAHMLTTMQTDYQAASGLTLFDRGLPDLQAFSAHYAMPDSLVTAAIRTMRYQPLVFFLPAWDEIYRSDEERRLDFEGATAFGDLTRQAYRKSGYVLLDVPKASLAERRAFLLEHLEI